MRNGDKIKGKIINVSPKEIEVKTGENVNLIDRRKIFMLRYKNGIEVFLGDKIVRKDGSIIKCIIIQEGDDYINYKTLDEPNLKINNSVVNKIIYPTGKVLKIRSFSAPPKKNMGNSASKEIKKPLHLHSNFFLRFQLGGGWGTTVLETNEYPDLTMKGKPVLLRADIGWSLFANLNLFITPFAGMASTTPDTKYGDETVTTVESTGVSDFGIGLNYYFMPINIYLSLSINSTLNQIVFKDGTKFRSNLGRGYYLALGKEWWLSENWGLGLAFFYYRNQITENKGSIKNQIAGFFLSLTYN